jgi:thiosulfate/3-mercaptopyruvate sulfurtransferase
MTFTTLIGTDALASRLSDPGLVIVDCRFDLADTAWGERAYAAKHIPGAVYAHLDRDLSGPKTGRNGRHPLPDPGALARTFGSLGIGEETQVVAYDQDAGMYASRLWWELRWLGHTAVAVLDGGFAKWVDEGRPAAAGVETRPARSFVARPQEDMVATLAEVVAHRADKDWRLVDARAPERFRGENETIDNMAGHIPGAVNHFFRTNLDDRGTFRSPDELRARARQTLGSVPPDRIICYCGSGVTACHNLLAMEHAGIRGAKLYAGSWSEWSSDASRPTAREGSDRGLVGPPR